MELHMRQCLLVHMSNTDRHPWRLQAWQVALAMKMTEDCADIRLIYMIHPLSCKAAISQRNLAAKGSMHVDGSFSQSVLMVRYHRLT